MENNFQQFKTKLSERGQMSLQILIFGFIAVLVLSGFIVWADVSIKSGSRDTHKAAALTIAEAGIEYYRWHLAHDPEDFQDGTGVPGPYVHPFLDKDGNEIGEFILDITPPVIGSTITTIRSTGHVTIDPTVEKIVEARMGIPSFARYSAVANADIRFGEGTEVFGILHSNGGVRFDGLSHNLVTSARESYDDPDHSGGNEFGVHTHVAPVDPLPPNAVPVRTDVFEVGRQFPVPEVNFDGITQDLSSIRLAAIADGRYIGPSNRVRTKFNTSYPWPYIDLGEGGYEIILKTNGTYDLYRVLSLFWWSRPQNQWRDCRVYTQDGWWNTWSINTKTLIGNYTFPANGVIFVEDDVWVSGQINNARLTIAAGRFPVNASTYAKILIENDLLYTNYNGTDAIGLIAQGNITSGMRSEDDLRIDAALIAQNGWAGRYYYKKYSSSQYPGCSIYDVRQKITLYGMIASNQRYGFAYTDGTGYADRIIIYDANLLYAPPPNFPLTGSTYETLSWDELK
jgi:hypothetical protein